MWNTINTRNFVELIEPVIWNETTTKTKNNAVQHTIETLKFQLPAPRYTCVGLIKTQPGLREPSLL